MHPGSPEESCPSSHSPSRRRVLGALATVGVGGAAGCFSPSMGGDVADLSIYNATDNPVEIDLEVTRAGDGAVVIDETFELAVGDSRNYRHPFSEDGSKRLSIVADGTLRATAEWTENAAGDASGLDVTVSEDEISVSQVVA